MLKNFIRSLMLTVMDLGSNIEVNYSLKEEKSGKKEKINANI